MNDKMSKDKEFSRVFELYFSTVIRVAAHTIQDYYLAQEIAQDVYMKLYMNWPENRTDEEIKAWLIVVSQRTAIDFLRKRKSEMALVGKVEKSVSGIHSRRQLTEKQNHLNPENIMMTGDLGIRVAEAIMNLREPYRNVIVYSAVVGLTQDEICKRLSISKNLLRVRLFRAREELREKFGPEIDRFLSN